MNEVQYKMKNGNYVQFKNSEVPADFSGYKISRDYKRLSSIMEYKKGNTIGNITYRPTKVPVIFTVLYGSYYSERYNNGNVIVECNLHKNQYHGEYRRYTINGDIQFIKYFYHGDEVTNDIKKSISFSGSDDSFTTYKFTEEEAFNMYMLYGSYFKFYDEYKMPKNSFDEITNFCLK